MRDENFVFPLTFPQELLASIVWLSRPMQKLYLCPLEWRQLQNCSLVCATFYQAMRTALEREKFGLVLSEDGNRPHCIETTQWLLRHAYRLLIFFDAFADNSLGALELPRLRTLEWVLGQQPLPLVLPALETCRIIGRSNSIALPPALARWTTLKSLKLNIPLKNLSPLAKLTRLENLVIENALSEGIEWPMMTCLEGLDLRQCSGRFTLPAFPSLRTLCLPNRISTVTCSPGLLCNVEKLETHQNLRWQELGQLIRLHIDVQRLPLAVPYLFRLSSLILCGNGKLAPKILTRLPCLTALKLDNCRDVEEGDLKGLSSLTYLRILPITKIPASFSLPGVRIDL